MKKSIFVLAIATFVAGISFTSCKSKTEKDANGMENTDGTTDTINKMDGGANSDNSTVNAADAEWQTYKKEAGMTIESNETQINDLTIAMDKPGNTFDAAYRSSINVLKEKNESLKSKIMNYESNKGDWASFKREFDSDMSELGKALKDLTVDNKK